MFMSGALISFLFCFDVHKIHAHGDLNPVYLKVVVSTLKSTYLCAQSITWLTLCFVATPHYVTHSIHCKGKSRFLVNDFDSMKTNVAVCDACAVVPQQRRTYCCTFAFLYRMLWLVQARAM